jgi:hypothetical protein
MRVTELAPEDVGRVEERSEGGYRYAQLPVFCVRLEISRARFSAHPRRGSRGPRRFSLRRPLIPQFREQFVRNKYNNSQLIVVKLNTLALKMPVF